MSPKSDRGVRELPTARSPARCGSAGSPGAHSPCPRRGGDPARASLGYETDGGAAAIPIAAPAAPPPAPIPSVYPCMRPSRGRARPPPAPPHWPPPLSLTAPAAPHWPPPLPLRAPARPAAPSAGTSERRSGPGASAAAAPAAGGAGRDGRRAGGCRGSFRSRRSAPLTGSAAAPRCAPSQADRPPGRQRRGAPCMEGGRAVPPIDVISLGLLLKIILNSIAR